MRYFLLLFALSVVVVVAVAGKRGSLSRRPAIEIFPDMVRQPKLRPQEPSGFFANGASSQPIVAGTVARGSAWQDSPENTGREVGKTNFVDAIPVPVTSVLLTRGAERYAISCLPCHGPQGDGNGVTKKLGMLVVATLHDKRIVTMPDGEIFNTITYGKNLMGSYGQNVSVSDRWAIVAYVRALQMSKLGTTNDVPSEARAALKK